MKRELRITKEPIDEAALVRERHLSAAMGAVVCFAGVVRGQEGDQPIGALEYEAYPKMALHQLNGILDRLQERSPAESIRVVHRVGVVPVNEASLWVEVVAPHREEAFAACQELIDELKRLVPIWKRPLGRKAE